MPEKQPKTNFQIASLCTGFLGIQIGFALQAGNVTRILQNFGTDLTQVALLWLIAPSIWRIDSTHYRLLE